MNQELYGYLEQELTRHSGLSAADYRVLVPLSESADGVLRARDLGSGVGWDRSRLSHHVSRMEKRGLVTREECSEDARGLMVRLTKAGRRAIEQAAPGHAETVRCYFFDQLSDNEIDTMAAVFDRLLENLSRQKT